MSAPASSTIPARTGSAMPPTSLGGPAPPVPDQAGALEIGEHPSASTIDLLDAAPILPVPAGDHLFERLFGGLAVDQAGDVPAHALRASVLHDGLRPLPRPFRQADRDLLGHTLVYT